MKKNKKNQTKRITTYVIVAVVLIAALYLISNNIAGLTDTTSDYDYSRQNNPEYYSLLPPMPDNFGEVQLMWDRGIIRDDPNIINSSYWKQPEWFPNYDKTFLPTLEMIAEGDKVNFKGEHCRHSRPVVHSQHQRYIFVCCRC